MKKLIFAVCIVLLGSALLFQGCGSKGPPRPPKASAALGGSLQVG